MATVSLQALTLVTSFGEHLAMTLWYIGLCALQIPFTRVRATETSDALWQLLLTSGTSDEHFLNRVFITQALKQSKRQITTLGFHGNWADPIGFLCLVGFLVSCVSI